MSESSPRSVLARKIAAHNGVGARPDNLVPALEAGLTRAVRRAGAPLDGLAVTVGKLDIALEASLDAALEALPEQGLVAATEDHEGRRGLLALEHSLVDALIEVQTTGRVEEVQGPPRRVTRIDEALCRDFIDLLFSAFAHETSGITGRDWPDRMGYGSQLKERSQINLLLPARGYHLLQVEVTAAGLKTGKLLILLPADPELARRTAKPAKATPPRPETWREDVLRALGQAPLALDAVLMRLHMPLSKVEALVDGDLIPFDHADLSSVTLEGDGAHVLARGKLGQMSGRRALRLASGKEAPKAGRPAQQAVAKTPTMPNPEAMAGQNASDPAGLADIPGLGADVASGSAPDMQSNLGSGGMAGDGPPMDMASALPDLPMGEFDPDAPIA